MVPCDQVPVKVSNQYGGKYEGPCGKPVEIQASKASLELSVVLGLDVFQSSTAWTLISGSNKDQVVDESGISKGCPVSGASDNFPVVCTWCCSLGTISSDVLESFAAECEVAGLSEVRVLSLG